MQRKRNQFFISRFISSLLSKSFQVTIKPVGPQPLSSTPIQSNEPVYNQQPINNMTITREGSPEYMVASADGTESVSQRSAKKRRRYIKKIKYKEKDKIYFYVSIKYNIFQRET